MIFQKSNEQTSGRLIDHVKAICVRLSEHGWKELFDQQGIDILTGHLDKELLKPLKIDRTQPGFEDFSLAGYRGIEPGRPQQSLLFHALASPQVTSWRNGNGQEFNLSTFPTLQEICIVENYVFGVVPPSIQELRMRADGAPLAIVVFSSEYRPAINTIHQKHSDLCFSRVGISRVGTAESLYLGDARGFLPFKENDDFATRVTPSLFSAYVAIKKKGDKDNFGPLRFKRKESFTKEVNGEFKTIQVEGDEDMDFWVPLHKIFSGSECIRGLTLNPQISAIHINEKLKKVHKAFGEQGYKTDFQEPELSNPPFSFTEEIADIIVYPGDASCLVTPHVHKHIVEIAKFNGKTLTYTVPKGKDPFRSSVNIGPRKNGARSAPEYVHARHKLLENNSMEDLNQKPDMIDVIKNGDYQAIHYLDFTGDGAVYVECPELSFHLPEVLPSYSMVSAIDYFPLVKQNDLINWWKQSVPKELENNIWPPNPGPPLSLCDTRYPANLSLTLEKLDIQNERKSVFNSTDKTISAIVGLYDSCNGKLTQINPTKNIRISSLTDGASGVFAPGWDSSIDRTEETDSSDDGSVILPGVTFFNNYGLGSPFPEDAMLCAALSSFWPAAAPDITRSFVPGNYATATPLTDDVMGFDGKPSWNQIPAPVHYEESKTVEYQRIEYGDFVQTALSNKFDFSKISRLTAEEYAARTLVTARVYINLGAVTREQKAQWAIFSFVNIPATDSERIYIEKESGANLSPNFCFRFKVFKFQITDQKTHFTKKIIKYDEMIVLFADPQTIVKKNENGKWSAFRY